MIQYHPICKSEGNHRFALEQDGNNVLFVIGLNPSTADDKKIDNTMQRVLGIVNRYGYDGYVMLNLSSERSTNPDYLAKELDTQMHKKNLQVISDYVQKYPHADVLVVWGDGITRRNYLPICLYDIRERLALNRKWLRIGGTGGITKNGHPRHLLYTNLSNGLDEFDIDAYVDK